MNYETFSSEHNKLVSDYQAQREKLADKYTAEVTKLSEDFENAKEKLFTDYQTAKAEETAKEIEALGNPPIVDSSKKKNKK